MKRYLAVLALVLLAMGRVWSVMSRFELACVIVFLVMLIVEQKRTVGGRR